MIEVIVVVGIVGILSALAVPRLNGARERSYVTAMQSDLSQLRMNQELHRRSPERTYAANLGDLPNFRQSSDVAIAITAADQDGWSAVATHPGTSRTCGFDTADDVIVCTPSTIDGGDDGDDDPPVEDDPPPDDDEDEEPEDDGPPPK